MFSRMLDKTGFTYLTTYVFFRFVLANAEGVHVKTDADPWKLIAKWKCCKNWTEKTAFLLNKNSYYKFQVFYESKWQLD